MSRLLLLLTMGFVELPSTSALLQTSMNESWSRRTEVVLVHTDSSDSHRRRTCSHV